jgi:hypothetical protein
MSDSYVRIIPIMSGSRGNCTYVEYGDLLKDRTVIQRFLIDTGGKAMLDGSSTADAIMKVLETRAGTNISQIDAVILTHNHEDHIGGLETLIPHLDKSTRIVTTEGTWNNIENEDPALIRAINLHFTQKPDNAVRLGEDELLFKRDNSRVWMFAASGPHDAAEGRTLCPVFTNSDPRLRGKGIITALTTDSGRYDEPDGRMINELHKYGIPNHITIEANNLPTKSWFAADVSLGRRISSGTGHASVSQADKLLQTLLSEDEKHISKGHNPSLVSVSFGHGGGGTDYDTEEQTFELSARKFNRFAGEKAIIQQINDLDNPSGEIKLTKIGSTVTAQRFTHRALTPDLLSIQWANRDKRELYHLKTILDILSTYDANVEFNSIILGEIQHGLAPGQEMDRAAQAAIELIRKRLGTKEGPIKVGEIVKTVNDELKTTIKKIETQPERRIEAPFEGLPILREVQADAVASGKAIFDRDKKNIIAKIRSVNAAGEHIDAYEYLYMLDVDPKKTYLVVEGLGEIPRSGKELIKTVTDEMLKNIRGLQDQYIKELIKKLPKEIAVPKIIENIFERYEGNISGAVKEVEGMYANVSKLEKSAERTKLLNHSTRLINALNKFKIIVNNPDNIDAPLSWLKTELAKGLTHQDVIDSLQDELFVKYSKQVASKIDYVKNRKERLEKKTGHGMLQANADILDITAALKEMRARSEARATEDIEIRKLMATPDFFERIKKNDKLKAEYMAIMQPRIDEGEYTQRLINFAKTYRSVQAGDVGIEGAKDTIDILDSVGQNSPEYIVRRRMIDQLEKNKASLRLYSYILKQKKYGTAILEKNLNAIDEELEEKALRPLDEHASDFAKVVRDTVNEQMHNDFSSHAITVNRQQEIRALANELDKVRRAQADNQTGIAKTHFGAVFGQLTNINNSYRFRLDTLQEKIGEIVRSKVTTDTRGGPSTHAMLDDQVKKLSKDYGKTGWLKWSTDIDDGISKILTSLTEAQKRKQYDRATLDFLRAQYAQIQQELRWFNPLKDNILLNKSTQLPGISKVEHLVSMAYSMNGTMEESTNASFDALRKAYYARLEKEAHVHVPSYDEMKQRFDAIEERRKHLERVIGKLRSDWSDVKDIKKKTSISNELAEFINEKDVNGVESRLLYEEIQKRGSVIRSNKAGRPVRQKQYSVPEEITANSLAKLQQEIFEERGRLEQKRVHVEQQIDDILRFKKDSSGQLLTPQFRQDMLGMTPHRLSAELAATGAIERDDLITLWRNYLDKNKHLPASLMGMIESTKSLSEDGLVRDVDYIIKIVGSDRVVKLKKKSAGIYFPNTKILGDDREGKKLLNQIILTRHDEEFAPALAQELATVRSQIVAATQQLQATEGMRAQVVHAVATGAPIPIERGDVSRALYVTKLKTKANEYFQTRIDQAIDDRAILQRRLGKATELYKKLDEQGAEIAKIIGDDPEHMVMRSDVGIQYKITLHELYDNLAEESPDKQSILNVIDFDAGGRYKPDIVNATSYLKEHLQVKIDDLSSQIRRLNGVLEEKFHVINKDNYLTGIRRPITSTEALYPSYLIVGVKGKRDKIDIIRYVVPDDWKYIDPASRISSHFDLMRQHGVPWLPSDKNIVVTGILRPEEIDVPDKKYKRIAYRLMALEVQPDSIYRSPEKAKADGALSELISQIASCATSDIERKISVPERVEEMVSIWTATMMSGDERAIARAKKHVERELGNQAFTERYDIVKGALDEILDIKTDNQIRRDAAIVVEDLWKSMGTQERLVTFPLVQTYLMRARGRLTGVGKEFAQRISYAPAMSDETTQASIANNVLFGLHQKIFKNYYDTVSMDAGISNMYVDREGGKAENRGVELIVELPDTIWPEHRDMMRKLEFTEETGSKDRYTHDLQESIVKVYRHQPFYKYVSPGSIKIENDIPMDFRSALVHDMHLQVLNSDATIDAEEEARLIIEFDEIERLRRDAVNDRAMSLIGDVRDRMSLDTQRRAVLVDAERKLYGLNNLYHEQALEWPTGRLPILVYITEPRGDQTAGIVRMVGFDNPAFPQHILRTGRGYLPPGAKASFILTEHEVGVKYIGRVPTGMETLNAREWNNVHDTIDSFLHFSQGVKTVKEKITETIRYSPIYPAQKITKQLEYAMPKQFMFEHMNEENLSSKIAETLVGKRSLDQSIAKIYYLTDRIKHFEDQIKGMKESPERDKLSDALRNAISQRQLTHLSFLNNDLVNINDDKYRVGAYRLGIYPGKLEEASMEDLHTFAMNIIEDFRVSGRLDSIEARIRMGKLIDGGMKVEPVWWIKAKEVMNPLDPGIWKNNTPGGAYLAKPIIEYPSASQTIHLWYNMFPRMFQSNMMDEYINRFLEQFHEYGIAPANTAEEALDQIKKIKKLIKKDAIAKALYNTYAEPVDVFTSYSIELEALEKRGASRAEYDALKNRTDRAIKKFKNVTTDDLASRRMIYSINALEPKRKLVEERYIYLARREMGTIDPTHFENLIVTDEEINKHVEAFGIEAFSGTKTTLDDLRKIKKQFPKGQVEIRNYGLAVENYGVGGIITPRIEIDLYELAHRIKHGTATSEEILEKFRPALVREIANNRWSSEVNKQIFLEKSRRIGDRRIPISSIENSMSRWLPSVESVVDDISARLHFIGNTNLDELFGILRRWKTMQRVVFPPYEKDIGRVAIKSKVVDIQTALDMVEWSAKKAKQNNLWLQARSDVFDVGEYGKILLAKDKARAKYFLITHRGILNEKANNLIIDYVWNLVDRIKYEYTDTELGDMLVRKTAAPVFADRVLRHIAQETGIPLTQLSEKLDGRRLHEAYMIRNTSPVEHRKYFNKEIVEGNPLIDYKPKTLKGVFFNKDASGPSRTLIGIIENHIRDSLMDIDSPSQAILTPEANGRNEIIKHLYDIRQYENLKEEIKAGGGVYIDPIVASGSGSDIIKELDRNIERSRGKIMMLRGMKDTTKYEQKLLSKLKELKATKASKEDISNVEDDLLYFVINKKNASFIFPQEMVLINKVKKAESENAGSTEAKLARRELSEFLLTKRNRRLNMPGADIIKGKKSFFEDALNSIMPDVFPTPESSRNFMMTFKEMMSAFGLSVRKRNALSTAFNITMHEAPVRATTERLLTSLGYTKNVNRALLDGLVMPFRALHKSFLSDSLLGSAIDEVLLAGKPQWVSQLRRMGLDVMNGKVTFNIPSQAILDKLETNMLSPIEKSNVFEINRVGVNGEPVRIKRARILQSRLSALSLTEGKQRGIINVTYEAVYDNMPGIYDPFQAKYGVAEQKFRLLRTIKIKFADGVEHIVEGENRVDVFTGLEFSHGLPARRIKPIGFSTQRIATMTNNGVKGFLDYLAVPDMNVYMNNQKLLEETNILRDIQKNIANTIANKKIPFEIASARLSDLRAELRNKANTVLALLSHVETQKANPMSPDSIVLYDRQEFQLLNQIKKELTNRILSTPRKVGMLETRGKLLGRKVGDISFALNGSTQVMVRDVMKLLPEPFNNPEMKMGEFWRILTNTLSSPMANIDNNHIIRSIYTIGPERIKAEYNVLKAKFIGKKFDKLDLRFDVSKNLISDMLDHIIQTNSGIIPLLVDGRSFAFDPSESAHWRRLLDLRYLNKLGKEYNTEKLAVVDDILQKLLIDHFSVKRVNDILKINRVAFVEDVLIGLVANVPFDQQKVIQNIYTPQSVDAILERAYAITTRTAKESIDHNATSSTALTAFLNRIFFTSKDERQEAVNKLIRVQSEKSELELRLGKFSDVNKSVREFVELISSRIETQKRLKAPFMLLGQKYRTRIQAHIHDIVRINKQNTQCTERLTTLYKEREKLHIELEKSHIRTAVLHNELERLQPESRHLNTQLREIHNEIIEMWQKRENAVMNLRVLSAQGRDVDIVKADIRALDKRLEQFFEMETAGSIKFGQTNPAYAGKRIELFELHKTIDIINKKLHNGASSGAKFLNEVLPVGIEDKINTINNIIINNAPFRDEAVYALKLYGNPNVLKLHAPEYIQSLLDQGITDVDNYIVSRGVGSSIKQALDEIVELRLGHALFEREHDDILIKLNTKILDIESKSRIIRKKIKELRRLTYINQDDKIFYKTYANPIVGRIWNKAGKLDINELWKLAKANPAIGEERLYNFMVKHFPDHAGLIASHDDRVIISTVLDTAENKSKLKNFVLSRITRVPYQSTLSSSFLVGAYGLILQDSSDQLVKLIEQSGKVSKDINGEEILKFRLRDLSKHLKLPAGKKISNESMWDNIIDRLSKSQTEANKLVNDLIQTGSLIKKHIISIAESIEPIKSKNYDLMKFENQLARGIKDKTLSKDAINKLEHDITQLKTELIEIRKKNVPMITYIDKIITDTVRDAKKGVSIPELFKKGNKDILKKFIDDVSEDILTTLSTKKGFAKYTDRALSRIPRAVEAYVENLNRGIKIDRYRKLFEQLVPEDEMGLYINNNLLRAPVLDGIELIEKLKDGPHYDLLPLQSERFLAAHQKVLRKEAEDIKFGRIRPRQVVTKYGVQITNQLTTEQYQDIRSALVKLGELRDTKEAAKAIKTEEKPAIGWFLDNDTALDKVLDKINKAKLHKIKTDTLETEFKGLMADREKRLKGSRYDIINYYKSKLPVATANMADDDIFNHYKNKYISELLKTRGPKLKSALSDLASNKSEVDQYAEVVINNVPNLATLLGTSEDLKKGRLLSRLEALRYVGPRTARERTRSATEAAKLMFYDLCGKDAEMWVKNVFQSFSINEIQMRLMSLQLAKVNQVMENIYVVKYYRGMEKIGGIPTLVIKRDVSLLDKELLISKNFLFQSKLLKEYGSDPKKIIELIGPNLFTVTVSDALLDTEFSQLRAPSPEMLDAGQIATKPTLARNYGQIVDLEHQLDTLDVEARAVMAEYAKQDRNKVVGIEYIVNKLKKHGAGTYDPYVAEQYLRHINNQPLLPEEVDIARERIILRENRKPKADRLPKDAIEKEAQNYAREIKFSDLLTRLGRDELNSKVYSLQQEAQEIFTKIGSMDSILQSRLIGTLQPMIETAVDWVNMAKGNFDFTMKTKLGAYSQWMKEEMQDWPKFKKGIQSYAAIKRLSRTFRALWNGKPPPGWKATEFLKLHSEDWRKAVGATLRNDGFRLLLGQFDLAMVASTQPKIIMDAVSQEFNLNVDVDEVGNKIEKALYNEFDVIPVRGLTRREHLRKIVLNMNSDMDDIIDTMRKNVLGVKGEVTEAQKDSIFKEFSDGAFKTASESSLRLGHIIDVYAVTMANKSVIEMVKHPQFRMLCAGVQFATIDETGTGSPACPTCRALDGRRWEINYRNRNNTMETDVPDDIITPPADTHIGCRCILIPYFRPDEELEAMDIDVDDARITFLNRLRQRRTFYSADDMAKRDVLRTYNPLKMNVKERSNWISKYERPIQKSKVFDIMKLAPQEQNEILGERYQMWRKGAFDGFNKDKFDNVHDGIIRSMYKNIGTQLPRTILFNGITKGLKSYAYKIKDALSVHDVTDIREAPKTILMAILDPQALVDHIRQAFTGDNIGDVVGESVNEVTNGTREDIMYLLKGHVKDSRRDVFRKAVELNSKQVSEAKGWVIRPGKGVGHTKAAGMPYTFFKDRGLTDEEIVDIMLMNNDPTSNRKLFEDLIGRGIIRPEEKGALLNMLSKMRESALSGDPLSEEEGMSAFADTAVEESGARDSISSSLWHFTKELAKGALTPTPFDRANIHWQYSRPYIQPIVEAANSAISVFEYNNKLGAEAIKDMVLELIGGRTLTEENVADAMDTIGKEVFGTWKHTEVGRQWQDYMMQQWRTSMFDSKSTLPEQIATEVMHSIKDTVSFDALKIADESGAPTLLPLLKDKKIAKDFGHFWESQDDLSRSEIWADIENRYRAGDTKTYPTFLDTVRGWGIKNPVTTDYRDKVTGELFPLGEEVNSVEAFKDDRGQWYDAVATPTGRLIRSMNVDSHTIADELSILENHDREDYVPIRMLLDYQGNLLARPMEEIEPEAFNTVEGALGAIGGAPRYTTPDDYKKFMQGRTISFGEVVDTLGNARDPQSIDQTFIARTLVDSVIHDIKSDPKYIENWTILGQDKNAQLAKEKEVLQRIFDFAEGSFEGNSTSTLFARGIHPGEVVLKENGATINVGDLTYIRKAGEVVIDEGQSARVLDRQVFKNYIREQIT